MTGRVPVVPGDGRVACQHCTARVEYRAVAGGWVDPDSHDDGFKYCCSPDVLHKPMPRVRADRT